MSGSAQMKLQPTIITQKEHAARREKLMAFFGAKDLLFFPGNKEIIRNTDISYDFRQESNFRYLTGINLPDVSALLVPREGKYILFAPNQTIDDKVWDGNMPNHADLKRIYGADEVYDPCQVKEIARKHGANAIHTLHGKSPFYLPGVKRIVDEELAGAMIEMRLVKSESEIKVIEAAINVTASGYAAVIAAIKPGMREHEIQAKLEYQFRVNGAEFSFPSIVTMDGNVLHNFELRRQFNSSVLEKGRMLLIDSGADIEGYSGDITRTYPINGKFSKQQAEIYELKGKMGDILAKGAHRLFVAHGLGHAMGLDDHDIGEYKDRVAGYSAEFPRETDFAIKYLRFARELQPGHVVTTEPGIYFIDAVLNNPEIRKNYKEFVNFDKAMKYMVTVSGIRLEDDVLIEKNGSARVLGQPIPEQRSEIESLMNRGHSGSGSVHLSM
ncbi:MAG: Xaa-Pro aminopeptidase [Candidatus Micrarchaeota archaeon]|nr:Xaa-Pro aminopeptidase [Candidatus Micrarchaeota archaeon]